MTPARWLVLLGSMVFVWRRPSALVGLSIHLPTARQGGSRCTTHRRGVCLWLSFAVHFVAVSPVFVCLSRRAQGRYVISLFFLLPLINAILMYRLVGPIIGSYTSAGTVLVLLGAWRLPCQGHV